MFNSLAMNILLFVLSATGIWFVATRLTNYLDTIAERTGMGRAFVGLLLLGLSTSLPEIVTTVTASAAGEAQLAGSNLLGGVAMQLTVLAVVEMFAIRGRPLTSMAPKAIILLQGVILVAIITMAIAAIAIKEIVTFKGVGLWSTVIFCFYIFSVFVIYRYEKNPRWTPKGDAEMASQDKEREESKKQEEKKYEKVSTVNLSLRTLAAALGVLVTGYLATKSAEAIVHQGKLSGSFVGATLLALATSLPEVSTTWSAMKLGAFTMAIANILGTNIVEVALFFPADLFYRKGPIINEMGNNSIFLAALGSLLTCIYLWGILERRDKTFFGLGQDSALVLVVYLLGITAYYFI